MSQPDETPFEPRTLFFYGTLMDPSVLTTVAGLDAPPTLTAAWIEGFEMKMWLTRYPTLLPTADGRGRIVGRAWKATSAEQMRRLRRYETSAYGVGECVIYTDDGRAETGSTFVWARGKGSPELSEGVFDLEYWQKNQKASIF